MISFPCMILLKRRTSQIIPNRAWTTDFPIATLSH
jgi:hypothetical protein